MIARYLVLTERMRTELEKIEQVVDHAEGAVSRAGQQPEDEDYFMAAAALDLHSFYAGVERLLALIATEIDGGLPKGPRWHRDLLEQMTLKVRGVRPAMRMRMRMSKLLSPVTTHPGQISKQAPSGI